MKPEPPADGNVNNFATMAVGARVEKLDVIERPGFGSLSRQSSPNSSNGLRSHGRTMKKTVFFHGLATAVSGNHATIRCQPFDRIFGRGGLFRASMLHSNSSATDPIAGRIQSTNVVSQELRRGSIAGIGTKQDSQKRDRAN